MYFGFQNKEITVSTSNNRSLRITNKDGTRRPLDRSKEQKRLVKPGQLMTQHEFGEADIIILTSDSSVNK